MLPQPQDLAGEIFGDGSPIRGSLSAESSIEGSVSFFFSDSEFVEFSITS
jgi:hypothetical protein